MLPPDTLWNDPDALVIYYNSNPIPINPQAGVLVASIIVSILGSYATLLLLGRRTSSKGFRNYGLLGLAALCFSAVAVWGMHFVSMISIRLRASPSVTWYLVFSKGMTALSLFVPLIATIFAFGFLGSDLEFQYWRVLVSGIILGLTIGLMHYSAAFQLPELDPSYTAVTVVFALILACVAATVALFLFFRFRSQWQDSFWKRSACAIFLAVAVCGMHYLGLGGTSYRAKVGASAADLAGGSDQSTRLTIAIGVMCGCIIALSIAIAVIDLTVRRSIRKKARHIVIASAAFDKTGRLLVKNDGTIPMQVIQTDADLNRVLGELDPRQPTFQWLYQLSFNWSLVTPFVPRILASFAARQNRTYREPTSDDRAVPRSTWETLLFRTRFVEASILLAQQLDISVESLGVMFDRVLTTGTKVPQPEEKEKSIDVEDGKYKSDDESSIHGITLRLHASEGVMLFVVREIGSGMIAQYDPNQSAMEKISGSTSDTVESYTSRGFRMAETRFFSKALADHMGVSKPEMDVFLSACKTYAKRGTRPVVQTGGAYLGLFGVRPTGTGSGLDVLVYNFARHQIPAYRLPEVGYPLSPAMRAWIRECSNMSMGEFLQKCNDAVHRANTSETGSQHSETTEVYDETLYEFQAAVAVAIEALTTALRCWPALQQLARLSPEVLELPTSEHDDKAPAQMVVLEVILPSPEVKLTPIQSRASGVQAPGLHSGRHESDKPPAPFVYTPFSLFSKSQAMILRSKGFTDFCRSTTSELAKVYPLIPTDVAGELAAVDGGTIKEGGDWSQDPGNPFSESTPQVPNRWNSRTSRLGRGLMVDVGRSNRRGSEHMALGSPSTVSENEDGDLREKGELSMGQSGTGTTISQGLQSPISHATGGMGMGLGDEAAPLSPGSTFIAGHSRSRPSTGGNEEGGGHSIGRTLNSLVTGRNYGNEGEGTPAMVEVHGPPVFAGIRSKTDGWFGRSMRTLERTDQAHVLDGIEY